MLPGVKVKDIKRFADERGFFSEILRSDWNDLLEGHSIVQANLSISYPGVIRAWHRHQRGQVECFTTLKGAIKICVYDDQVGSPTRGQLDEIILSVDAPQIVRIPGMYWHGTKTLGTEASLTLYFINKLYDYSSPDEERRPWNDPKIIDPKTGNPYDWNKPPHK